MASLALTRRHVTLVVVLVAVAALFATLSPGAVAQGITDRDFREGLDAAGASEDSSGEAGDSPWLLLVKMLASLAFVLGLIVLIAWLYRRYGPAGAIAGGAGRQDAIRIVATRMLGGRRSLMLVRVRGQTLLLGVTPQSIQCLTEIHEIEGEWAQPVEEDATAPTARGAFGRQLGRFVNQTISDKDTPASRRETDAAEGSRSSRADQRARDSGA